MLNRGARARRQGEPHYVAVSVCVEGTAPAGGWIRRQSRRTTERRRAGKRRIELYQNDNFFFISAPQAARSILFSGTGEKGNRLEVSVNESKCEGADRVRYADEAVIGEPQQQEDGTRRPTTHTHTIITRAAIVFFSVLFMFFTMQ